MRNLYRLLLIYLFIVLYLFLFTNNFFAQNSNIIKIVAHGEPTPLGGTFGTPLLSDLNDNEAVLFVSEIAPSRSVPFVASGDEITSVISDSQFVEGLGMITRSSVSSINNNGSIAFYAQLVNGDVKRDGLFIKTVEGSTTPLVFNDDPTDGGTIGTPSLRSFSLNNNGDVAFAGYITPEPFRQAIFTNSGGTVSKVVATGETTPLGGTYKFAFMNIMDFNDAGTVLFGSDIEGGSSTEAIFAAIGGSITKIVAKGDPSLDGKQFTYLDPAAINNLGDIVFEASVGVDFGSEYDGLFLYSGGAISLITRTGDPAPGGGTFGTFSLPDINDSKTVIFEASIDGGPSPYGIFIVINGIIGKVVTNGEAAPVGGSFSSVAYPLLNAGGSVIFNGYIEGGSAASGIFLWNGGPKLEVSRDTVEFIDIVPGQTARLDMELTNSGGKTLEIQEITASPSPPFGVENVPAVPFSIEPEQKTQFLVTYSSTTSSSTKLEKTSEILQNGTLTIKTNAPNSPTIIPIITPPSLHMLPNGVAYDPLNPYLEGGGAYHSKFTNLKINGSSLDLVNQVIFEPSDHIEVTRINVTPNTVNFDIIVYHDAVLGERDLFLRTSDGKEINVTKTTGKKFIITKITTQFNQAVDQAAVNSADYRDKLVAHKQGVIRIQFQDPNQYGHTFNGRIEISGFGIIPASAGSILVPREAYSEADILNGRDYLTMPIQNPLTAGKKEFKVLLNRLSDGNYIDGPIINREVIESKEFSVVGLSFRVKQADGTTIDPIPDVEAQKGLDLIKLVYPISSNRLTYKHIGTRDLPASIQTQQLSFQGSSITTLTAKGAEELLNQLGIQYSKTNQKRRKEGKPEINAIIAYLPNQALYEDLNKDGVVDARLSGLTHTVMCVTIAAVSNSTIQGTTAHEIGHEIQGSLSITDLFNELHGFGDEYKSGFFDCEKNPPVAGLTGFNNMSCANSPFINDIHGDSSGTYSDLSGFNAASMRPMLTYKGTAQSVVNYNFMSAVVGDDRTWVQPSVYDELLKILLPLNTQQNINAGSRSLAATGIRLSGLIYTNDTFEFNDFEITTMMERTPISNGPYSLEMQDNMGVVLASQNFGLDFIRQSEPPMTSDFDFFNIVMDFPDGTKKIALKKNGVEIGSRTVSNNPPAVQIFPPSGNGNSSGDISLNWNGSDPDGDALRYTLLYSADNNHWLPIESNISSTTYIWNSDRFPGGNSAKLAIIASDGINTGESEILLNSGITKKTPNISFTNPVKDTTYDGISPIIFAASGYDPEDGTLDPASYIFTSNIDGQIGSGSPFYVNKLSAGQHIISVSAQDSDGNIARDSVSIIAQIPVSVSSKKTNIVPEEFKLYQNYPNPFNPSTNIQFDIPEASHVTIKIYDIQGQEIKTLVDREYSAGQYTVVWNGNGDRTGTLSSGVYFIQMRTEDFMIVKKAVLIR